jgi:hypothetical protein
MSSRHGGVAPNEDSPSVWPSYAANESFVSTFRTNMASWTVGSSSCFGIGYRKPSRPLPVRGPPSNRAHVRLHEPCRAQRERNDDGYSSVLGMSWSGRGGNHGGDSVDGRGGTPPVGSDAGGVRSHSRGVAQALRHRVEARPGRPALHADQRLRLHRTADDGGRDHEPALGRAARGSSTRPCFRPFRIRIGSQRRSSSGRRASSTPSS